MSTSQRVSRGFHRLAVFLAAIPLLVGGALSIWIASDQAKNGSVRHQELICASEYLIKLSDERRKALTNAHERLNASRNEAAPGPWDKDPIVHPSTLRPDEPPLMDETVDLKVSGCSSLAQTVPTQTALSARERGFSYAATITSAVALGLAITLAVSLAVYVVVRAIGWVIGGFAAS